VASKRVLGAVLVAAAFFLTACGSRLAAPTPGRVLDVTERDFSIKVSAHKLIPGDITLRVANRGPDAHELIMVRSDKAQLPLRSDGMTVDEEGLEKATVGVFEPGEPGSVRELHVTLTKGRYVLLCNMSGHFMGGMETTVNVG
jgi:uncharacterized cupredoxin-like copper-binding protein